MERCRLCGNAVESFGGYCLRCDKTVADVQDELAREFKPEENVV